jgi:hypothetical protein
LDDDAKQEVLLALTHRGRQYQMRVSAKGWAQMFLRENPHHEGRHSTRQEWEQKALRQGHIVDL